MKTKQMIASGTMVKRNYTIIAAVIFCIVGISCMSVQAAEDPAIESIEYTPSRAVMVMDQDFDVVDEFFENEYSDLHPSNVLVCNTVERTDDGEPMKSSGIHSGDVLTVNYTNGEQKRFTSETFRVGGGGSGEFFYCIGWYDEDHVLCDLDVTYDYENYVKRYKDGTRIPGTYNTKVTVMYEGKQTDYMMKITVTGVPKVKNPIVVTPKKITVNYSKLKKSKKVISRAKAMTLKKAKGSVRFKKISGHKKLTINKKSGKITIGKKLKKGTYKLRVQVICNGDSQYLSAKRTITIKVKVK